MKNLLKISLLGVFLFSFNTVFAIEGEFILKSHEITPKSVRFSMLKAEDVHLSLFSARDGAIYEEDIHTDGAKSKVYDLNALPDGDYSLEVSSYTKLVTYKIAIQNNRMVVSEPLATTASKPLLTKLADRIVLNLNNVEQAPIEVGVFGDHNECVYKQVFLDRAKLSKVFNISKTDFQSLTFIVKMGERKFTETVSL